MLKAIILLLALIMTFISFMVINTFSSNNIKEHTRDIGLLRALGAGKRTVIHIYVLESGMLGVVSGIFAVFVSMGLSTIRNLLPTNMAFILDFSMIQLLLTVVIGGVIFIISSLPSIIAASKMIPKRALFMEM